MSWSISPWATAPWAKSVLLGTTYTDSLTETIGPEVIAGSVGFFSDTFNFSITVAALAQGLGIYPTSIAESVALSSGDTSNQLFSATLSEGVSLVDTYLDTDSAIYNETLLSSLILADSLLSSQVFVYPVTAQITLFDDVASNIIVATTLAEAIVAADALGAEQISVSSIGEFLTLTATVAGEMLIWPAPSDVMFGVHYGPTGDDFTGTAVLGNGTQIIAYRSDVHISTPTLRIALFPKNRTRPQQDRDPTSLRAKPKSKYVHATTVPLRTDVFTEQNEVFVTTSTESISV